MIENVDVPLKSDADFMIKQFSEFTNKMIPESLNLEGYLL